MGFQRSVMKLVWAEDTEFNGFEVTMKRVSIATSLQADEYDRAINSNTKSESERNLIINAMAELIARHLISWNLEDEDGKPVVVPFTPREANDPDTPAKLTARVKVIQQIDLPMMKQILQVWIKTATHVSEASPLDSTSPSGKQFPEDSLPMEVSLPNQPS